MSSASATAAAGGGGGGGKAAPKVNYGSATGAGGALAAFAAYDKDGDGKIDAGELLSLDADGDGIVTEEEIADILRRMKARIALPSARVRVRARQSTGRMLTLRDARARPPRTPCRPSVTYRSTRRSAAKGGAGVGAAGDVVNVIICRFPFRLPPRSPHASRPPRSTTKAA